MNNKINKITEKDKKTDINQAISTKVNDAFLDYLNAKKQREVIISKILENHKNILIEWETSKEFNSMGL